MVIPNYDGKKKKDGSWRFCVDYRKFNSVTHQDAYPLPRIDATLDSLVDASYFTTLDLASGYWQVEVEEHDKEDCLLHPPRVILNSMLYLLASPMHLPPFNV